MKEKGKRGNENSAKKEDKEIRKKKREAHINIRHCTLHKVKSIAFKIVF